MHILGIDFGGTGVKGAPVDTVTGTLLQERHRIPTPQPSTPDAVAGTVAELTEPFAWKGPIAAGPSTCGRGPGSARSVSA